MILLAESIYKVVPGAPAAPHVVHWLVALVPPVLFFMILSVCRRRRECGEPDWLSCYEGKATLHSTWLIVVAVVVLAQLVSEQPLSSSFLRKLQSDWFQLSGSESHGAASKSRVIGGIIVWFVISLWATLLAIAIGAIVDEYRARSATRSPVQD